MLKCKSCGALNDALDTTCYRCGGERGREVSLATVSRLQETIEFRYKTRVVEI